MLLRLAGDSVDLGAQAVAIVRQDKLLWVATMDKMISCYTGPFTDFILHSFFLHYCLSFHYLSLSVSLFNSPPVFLSLSPSLSISFTLFLSIYISLTLLLLRYITSLLQRSLVRLSQQYFISSYCFLSISFS